LIFDFTVFQMVAKTTFHTIHGRFQQTAAMIADGFFLSSAAMAAGFHGSPGPASADGRQNCHTAKSLRSDAAE
jgi:hypothetical protein